MIQELTNQNYKEVYEILNELGEDYINRIPEKLYNLIKEEASQELKSNEKKAFSRETVAFIGFLHYNYWCDSEEEKKELMDVFKENEAKHERELCEKYNPDVFGNTNVQPIQEKQNQEIENKNMDLVAKSEEKWYNKIINFIKNIFKRRKES